MVRSMLVVKKYQKLRNTKIRIPTGVEDVNAEFKYKWKKENGQKQQWSGIP